MPFPRSSSSRWTRSCTRSTDPISTRGSLPSSRNARRASIGPGRATPGRARRVDAKEHVTVLGAGTMGHGIAQVCAMAGYAVTLADATAELAGRGVDRIRGNLDEGVKRGKLQQSDADAALSRIDAAPLEAAC